MARLREKVVDGALAQLPWLAGCLAVAGVVHLVSILAMPRLAPNDAFARVAAVTQPFRMIVLPYGLAAATGAPFEDPALAVGVCRYDLVQGPLRLRGVLSPDEMMLFSFHARYGELFYSMTDRGAQRGRLDVLLATPRQIEAAEANDNEDELPEELRITAPRPEGYLLVRALAERPDEMDDAKARIAALACGVEREASDPPALGR